MLLFYLNRNVLTLTCSGSFEDICKKILLSQRIGIGTRQMVEGDRVAPNKICRRGLDRVPHEATGQMSNPLPLSLNAQCRLRMLTFSAAASSQEDASAQTSLLGLHKATAASREASAVQTPAERY